MMRTYSQELTDYHSANVDEVNKKLEDIGRQVEEIKLDKITEDFATKQKKLADLEDSSRGNNLCFEGFQEETNETWEEIESITTDILKEKLRIEEDISIERAHHTGKTDGFYILIEKRSYGTKKNLCKRGFF